MKKAILFIASIVSALNLTAQKKSTQLNVQVVHPTQFSISRPLRELFVNENEVESRDAEPTEMNDRERRKPQQFKYTSKDGEAYREDVSVRQTTMGTRPAKTPVANFEGQLTNANPPDPTGAAGPLHYVQMVNATKLKIWNKTTGVAIGTAINLGSLWSPAVASVGDPVVLYDKYADRWVLTHIGTGNNQVGIAVSTSGDPTGTYYTYTYSFPDFPDYPKYSIWADGYYMTANYSAVSPQGSDAVFCYERNEMLVGNPAARFIISPFEPGVNSNNFYTPMPADADGQLPPFGTPLPFVSYYENSWGGGSDSLKIWNVAVDWTPVTPTATVSGPDVLVTAPFDGTFDANWDDIPQPTTGSMLDGIGGIIQFRVQWRKWTGYNTMVMCWPVNISSSPVQRSVRWAELRQDQGTGAWSIYQESTYAPDGYSRWLGSIAMDDEGNIGLCYSKSGPTALLPNIFPSLGYTGRLSTDPLNTMTFAETIPQYGSGYRSGNRFGDYSQTSMDPDGLTFWNTGEYVNTTGGQRTRVYSFRLSSLTDAAATPISNSEISVFQSGNSLVVKATHLPAGDFMVLDLFDATGRVVRTKMVSPETTALTASIDIESLSKGNYLVRLGKSNSSFQKVIKVLIH